jgi:hypothetical protein
VNLVNLVLSQLITFLFLGFAVAMLIKVFQASSDLSEIKDLLSEIKRNTAEAVRPDVALPSLASPAALMRAVHQESADYQDSLVEPPQS